MEQDNKLIEEKKDSEKTSEVVNKDDDLIVDPYNVINKTGKEIDYERLIKLFGCERITPEQLKKIETLTNRPIHHFLKRDVFFSHRDLNHIISNYEKGKPFFLYTGRGPSSESMHLGHLMPFIFTKYLQDAFDVPLVIQVTDDEKYFHKGEKDIDTYTKFGYDNIKDIIACGFDLDKTFIFLDTEYIGHMYKNVCRFQKHITYNQIKGLFGLEESDNSGKIAYPAIQAAPALCTSFPHIFGKRKDVLCLIPQGIDQDLYFRMTRDICSKLKVPKPASIHSKFFPALQGASGKMSASDLNSAIFLTDSPKDIKSKVNKYAFSGGGATLEEHKAKGANLDVDVPYQYLRFFLEDDQRLEEIKVKYGSGQMLTSEVKEELIKCLTKLVTEHQERRKAVTDDMIKKFMEIRPLKFFEKKQEAPLEKK